MSGKKERAKRDHPLRKRSCNSCPWWGLSSVNRRCPDCGARTKIDA